MPEYGAQGVPISVSRDPEPRVAPPQPAQPAAPAPVYASEAEQRLSAPVAPAADPTGVVRTEEGVVKPEPHDTNGAENEVVDHAAENEVLRARLAAVAALVSTWDTKAASILVKGDYQKGARIATVECSDDLRRTLGI